MVRFQRLHTDTEPTQVLNLFQDLMPAFSAAIQIEATKGDIEIPVNGVRKAIAEQMVKSKYEIPHAYMMVEVDVTNLVQYRDGIKE